jgi:hypothetical protein
MAENVNSTTTPEIDYKAEFERIKGELDEAKNTISKVSSEAADYKKRNRELLSKEGQKEADQEAREARYKEIERENNLYKVKERLAKSITDEKTLNKLANLYADGKVEEAIDLTNTYIAESKVELEKEIQAKLMQQNAEPTAPSGTAKTLTKAEIMQIADPEARQKAIQENVNLFI